MSLPGCWEFPGGKVEAREEPRSALAREIHEELGLTINVGPWIGRGESRVDGREIVLDVYHANGVQGEPHPKEHAQTRWIDTREIEELDWAHADRPVLPILKRVLGRGLRDRPLPGSIPIVSVDWAKETKGRAVYTASPKQVGWSIERPLPPDGGWSLGEVLELAERLAEPFGGSALVAIDAALGVPVGYGRQTGLESFPEVMDWLHRQGALARSIRDPDQWCPESPFFGVNPGEGGLNRYVERAGGRAVFYRECDRVTGGNPVFAVSGIPGTVGSGSAALWREILDARQSHRQELRIWPFEVELDEVSDAGVLAIAESYPRACYGVALAPSLPALPRSIAKTDSNERRARLHELTSAPWVHAADVELGGLERAAAGEDDFDALMQAAALVRMVASEIPLSSHLADPAWEGGILGTGGLVLREPSRARSRPRRAQQSRSRSGSRTGSLKQCPIPGCQKVFRSGRLGWDGHVGSASLHPEWEPTLSSPEERKLAFREQFSEWFDE
jgi:8-oxo-dGTP diphosphatase